MGLSLWKLHDILKHTKDFIFNVLYIGYMYTYTHRKIYHMYILEYNLGDMEKQHHQGLKLSLLHSLHVARYTRPLGATPLRCVTLKYEGNALLCVPSSLVTSQDVTKF